MALRVQQTHKPKHRVWIFALAVFLTVLGAGALLHAAHPVGLLQVSAARRWRGRR